MSRSSRSFRWSSPWILVGGIVVASSAAVYTGVNSGWRILPGVIFLGLGLVYMTNWRGTAEAAKSARFGPLTPITRASWRVIFGVLAVAGAVMLISGIVGLVRELV